MSTLRALRRRIRSVQNTQQITKAMEMVAASKLRRAQSKALSARPYAVKISEMLGNLAGAASELDHPLFKARDYFRRRRYPVLAAHTPLPTEASLEFARTLTQDLIARFLSGEVDRVEIMFTRFISALNRKVIVDPFLPVGAGAAESAPTSSIFEPDAESIFAELLPRYATAKLFAALADALASEHSARMIAMGSARKNAGELIDLLTLRRNRLRQAAITKELLDIVGGAEALK